MKVLAFSPEPLEELRINVIGAAAAALRGDTEEHDRLTTRIVEIHEMLDEAGGTAWRLLIPFMNDDDDYVRLDAALHVVRHDMPLAMPVLEELRDKRVGASGPARDMLRYIAQHGAPPNSK